MIIIWVVFIFLNIWSRVVGKSLLCCFELTYLFFDVFKIVVKEDDATVDKVYVVLFNLVSIEALGDMEVATVDRLYGKRKFIFFA